jgi:hypothetical protein
MTLKDYVGLEGNARVYCKGHDHTVRVTVREVQGTSLLVVTDGEWCSMVQTMDDQAWVAPLDPEDDPGDSPLIGESETGLEIHVDL